MGSSHCGLTVEKRTLYEESGRTHRNKRKYTGKWKLAIRFAGLNMQTVWRKFKQMPSADQVEAKLQEIAEQLVAANTDSSAASHLVQPSMGEVQGMKVLVSGFIIIGDCFIFFLSSQGPDRKWCIL